MLPEALFSYNTNFNKKPKSTSRPYTPSFKVKLLDLIRPDYHYAIPTLERRIAVLLWFCQTSRPFKKGSLYHGLSCIMPDKYSNSYPTLFNGGAFSISRQVQTKITELLLNLNVDQDVWMWREKTGLLDINEIIDIPVRTYRYRAAMPIKTFESFENILDKVMEKRDSFCWGPNSSHDDARVIQSINIGLGSGKHNFYYIIKYTTPDHPNGGWEVNIRSNETETFVDFVLRLFDNLTAIFQTGECLEPDGKYSPYYSLKS